MDPNQQMARALMGAGVYNQGLNQQLQQAQQPIQNFGMDMLGGADPHGLVQPVPPAQPIAQPFGSHPHGSIYTDPRTGRVMVKGM